MGKHLSFPRPSSSLLLPLLLLLIPICLGQFACKTYERCKRSDAAGPSCVDKNHSLPCAEERNCKEKTNPTLTLTENVCTLEPFAQVSRYLFSVNALYDIASMLNVKFPRSYSNESCGTSGITCNCNIHGSTACHVTQLSFVNDDLSGVVPSELANLKFLEKIYLFGNNLEGSIPESLGSLQYLSRLDLSSNSLDGHIPESLGKLYSLEYLDLSDNKLHGSIPKSFGDLSKLATLRLYNNFLDGQIPSSFSGLQSLISLSVYGNRLSGPLPDALGRITSLQRLDLSKNKLFGNLSSEFGNLKYLEYMDLSENELSSGLPATLGNLKNLYYIDLSVNNFSGELPKSFKNLSNLKYFLILGNSISGLIPDFIGEWKNLTVLSLIGNSFDGPLPNEISQLPRLTKLWISDLRGNTSFCPSLSNLTNMNSLILRNCSINTTIPDDIGYMTYLSYIDLSFNKLIGNIPNSFKNLSLQYLYLMNNSLSGSIPDWIPTVNFNVDLSYNNFSEVNFPLSKIKSNVNLFLCCPSNNALNSPLQITTTYCNNQSKKYDSLYINCGGKETTFEGKSYERDLQPTGPSANFTSPNGNWAYSSSGDFVASSDNFYALNYGSKNYIRNKTCGISVPDTDLYLTARLSPLSLKYHGLCLDNGKYNVTLRFAEIAFVEENLMGKRIFDVFIQGKMVLKDFNIRAEAKENQTLNKNFTALVTDNTLEIHFYWGGKGSIYISPGLYGPLISAISATQLKDKKLSIASIAGITGGSVVVLAVLVLAFFWKMGWLGRKNSQENVKVIEYQNSYVTLGQIIEATQNFSPEKRIGRGGFGAVYKAELQNGNVLAVKQLSQNSRQGTPEFVTEVGILTSIRHENLVRLLGSYSGEDQVLLIYEYMENNSLATALFGTQSRLELNWETRYKICLGVARGLFYLHEGTKMKIIHRDIKASNILLDRDFKAKISDFGLAKLYDGDQTHMLDKVGGTEGYIAPEYAARGFYSEKTDVYSYGVLTLEIISGRSNTKTTSNESRFLIDDAYVYYKEGRILDLIDEAVKFGKDYSVTQATAMLSLALTCINLSPQLRPKMSEVVAVLEGKKTLEHVPPIDPTSLSWVDVPHPQAASISVEGTSSLFSSHSSGKERDETKYVSTDTYQDISEENAVSQQPS